MAGLRITEIMYNPDNGSDFEFIELQNVSGETLDLTGVRLSDGIEFEFPSMTLAPGEYVLVVGNVAAFEAKYGTGLPVAGAFDLNLSNGGEEIVLQLPDPFQANILKFTYDDAWYPLTDGSGYSLEIVNPSAPIADWNSPSAWRTGELQGTPGSTVFLSAGADQLIVLPGLASLLGEASGTWSPTLLWTKKTGPGAVVFTAPSSLVTDATFSQPGTYTLLLTGQDGPLILTSEVIVTVDDTYDAWKARLGVSGGPFDNDDSDDLLNIEEYAYEMDPFLAEVSPTPPYVMNGADFVIDLVVYPRKSDILVNLESSPDVSAWQVTTPVFVSGTPDQQLLQLTTDTASAPRVFFRYAVTLVP